MNRLPTMLAVVGVTWMSLIGAGNAAPTNASVQDAALVKEIEDYRKRRVENLLQPDGWTAITGMHWLEPGRYSVGSAADSNIRLSIGPARIGVIEEKDGRALFTAEPGVALVVDGAAPTGPVELKRYGKGTPATTVAYDGGKGSVSLIVSGGRRAIRVRHADAPTRKNFAGLDYYPIDAGWRIKGKFEPHPPGRVVPVLDVLGGLNDQANPGVVVFERDGRTFRLEVIGDSGRGLSLMFADRTNGKGSYPSGRFLSTGLPDANGEVLIDFNRTYTPPCAFSEFGTCLLPPPENRLDLAVTAGEKTYKKTGSHL
ncbi:DUF1684 domain-containing protein [Steroidobacter sp.]|uniref:DUF1684 domain-containing protein n=1 Tax=Steroidobacter sp. TaxID=1978227 RepID=UPI001A4D18C0|nr:DUF1684 domain-containing protein [Steroidobacter sp.]MBL8265238.1 DUF1684 domain-containing protein [Steroidobacter sp.]